VANPRDGTAGRFPVTRGGFLALLNPLFSNGRMEGINNKIGIIKHRAYGVHSAAALIAMVFLCCSGILVPMPL
jgi:transposase